jgi:hypothetical protein
MGFKFDIGVSTSKILSSLAFINLIGKTEAAPASVDKNKHKDIEWKQDYHGNY